LDASVVVPTLESDTMWSMVSVAVLRGGKTGLPVPRLDEPPGGEDASPGLHGSLNYFEAIHRLASVFDGQTQAPAA
jgi:hypothetical protein